MGRALWLRYRWTPELQEIGVDDVTFAHPRETNTSPSHDVAHLLAAASGLPWAPMGARESVCFSEFNSVFIEHLANHVVEHVHGGAIASRDILPVTLEHVRWFVEVHYAPFPVDFDEALERFRDGVDLEAVVRLAPVYFRTRAVELHRDDHRQRSFGAAFMSTWDPGPGVYGRDRAELEGQLRRLLRRRALVHRR